MDYAAAEPPPPPPPPSPSPYKHHSSLFKDISNFKTPKRPTTSKISTFQSPCPQFFTASKQTPRTSSSLRRPRPTTSSAATAVRKLKAVELQQSQSSRKLQIRKEQSLKSLAKSLTVWLNFLFENPRSCGCNFPVDVDRVPAVHKGKKRESSGFGVEVRVEAAWRDPKRQRDSSWRAAVKEDEEEDYESEKVFSGVKYSKLQTSLKLLCSFDDLMQRMRLYLSLASCKEVLDSMIQVYKNIDEGRLKMKVHCPLVTDVGLRKKAIKVLMSYNPIWLRIGLYIIFGGDSLLSDRDSNSDEENAFLKMIIEKQMFAHAGLAKEYAYNKKVEGLYRPGYYEALGNVILKRFLLLVLILDRAKSLSSLPLKYGIDGLDGGSPLLFLVQSSIKSSHQVIQDFLSSEIMLGEGNVSAHLVILGYKVSHQQSPIVDFDFRVTDLFDDLQDGLRLCRAIQLLLDDSSILMKMAVPSDTHKRHLANCATALQYLRQAGVVLHDDGMKIVEDDIADGDKELTISLLWNMFVHLQLPLLVKKTTLSDEICKIRGSMDSVTNVDSPPLDMLLDWIQAICETYDCKIDSFSSLVDGKAIWCLLDYYFRKQLCCAWSSKDPDKSSHGESIMLATYYSDAVHNFLLSQKLMLLLGNFPEVLQISDILEYSGVPNDRSVVILLVFLSSQLLLKQNMDQLNFHKLLGCECQSPGRMWFGRPEPAQIQEEIRGQHTEDTVRNFKVVQAWWQDMAARNIKLPKPVAPVLQNFSTDKDKTDLSRVNSSKRIMQIHQDWSETDHNACIPDIVNAATVIQRYTRGWFARSRHFHGNVLGHNYSSFPENEASDVNAAIVIQRYTRGWLARSQLINGDALIYNSSSVTETEATDVHMRAAVRIQSAWKNYNVYPSHHNKHFAAVIIQSHWRCWLLRRRFHIQTQATIKIQSVVRMSSCRKAYQRYKIATGSAIIIQSYVRGLVARNIADKRRHLIVTIQRYFRGWLIRRYLICQRKAAVKIQSAIRCWRYSQAFQCHHNKHFAAVIIQRHWRCWLLRRRFHIQTQATIKIQSVVRMSSCRKAYQRYKIATGSAIIIQSYVRGWVARNIADKRRHLIVTIQRYFRGWLIRRYLICQRKAAVKIQSAIRCWRYSQAFQCHKQAAEERRYLICQRKAAVKIQSAIRCWRYRQAFQCHKQAAVEIQRIVRGKISRKNLLGASSLHPVIPHGCLLKTKSCFYSSAELNIVFHSVLKLQRWWKCVLSLKCRTKSAVIIQSHIRGWLARKKASKERHSCIVIQSYWRGYQAKKKASTERHSSVVIQSHWRGYQARKKESREQIVDIRLRVQKSAASVDDSMRIINRLIAALQELLRMKSISNIRHTCATLDMATRYSQICCERLVDAGAIKTLLKLIHSCSRSIPDQEVLKHALLTLRNLARYPHLVEVLIDIEGSVETILWELLRNKEEGYFIASELLKKICSSHKGAEAVRKSPAHLKRLRSLVEELSRQSCNDKRNCRLANARENTEKRLREAVEILKMATE